MRNLLIAIVVLGAIGLAAAWYVGALAPVTITDEYAGPFYAVCEDNIGSYGLLDEKIKDVQKALTEGNVAYTDGIAVINSDPITTPPDQLQSIGGVIVAGPVQVSDSKLTLKVITYDHYAVATFNGLPMLGLNHVYPKVYAWIKANGKTLGWPVVEIHTGDGMKKQIKYMFPIK
jgi:effector-binding domain-containing protein